MFRFVIGTFHSVDVVSPRAELYFFYVIYENTGLCEAEMMRVTFTSEAFTEAAWFVVSVWAWPAATFAF